MILPGKKNEMTDFDKYELNNYDPIVLANEKKITLNFHNEQSVHGLGWSHNYFSPNPGIWTEGNLSTLLFKLDENTNADYTIKIKLGSLITKKNKPIYFNRSYNTFRIINISFKGSFWD